MVPASAAAPAQVKLSRTRKAGNKTLENAAAAAEAAKALELARQAERMSEEFAKALGDGSEEDLLVEANKKVRMPARTLGSRNPMHQ